MSLCPYRQGIGANMYGRSGRRSPGRFERRLQRRFGCFPKQREAHLCLCVSRRRVPPEPCTVRPSTRIVSSTVRETLWHWNKMPYFRNGGSGDLAAEFHVSPSKLQSTPRRQPDSALVCDGIPPASGQSAWLPRGLRQSHALREGCRNRARLPPPSPGLGEGSVSA